MTATDWIWSILLGGILGVLGQGIRVVAGLKKVNDQMSQEKKFSTLFQPKMKAYDLSHPGVARG